MSKNNLSDLNNYLFEQIERLSKADQRTLHDEVERSKSLSALSSQVINNHKLVFEVAKAINTDLTKNDLPSTFKISETT